MKDKGYRVEQAWLEFIDKQTQKFGCPLVVKAATISEDREQGWDMRISHSRKNESVLVDITTDIRKKRVHTWIKRDVLGYKDKVDLTGNVRKILVVNTRLLSSAAFFSWVEKRLVA